MIAAALVGSLATGAGDRWSDLDLTFALKDGADPSAVLRRLAEPLVDGQRSVHLFDLPFRSSLYRVLLLPNCLQVGLSVTPAAGFGAISPNFKLLFGTAREQPTTEGPAGNLLFGYAVHHAARARFCIERDRLWQAQYWISGLRDHALSLACLKRDLPPQHGRGLHQLPSATKAQAADSLICALNRQELKPALNAAIDLLQAESDCVSQVSSAAASQLALLKADWPAVQKLL